jgi:predicted nucleic-acid-binding protein
VKITADTNLLVRVAVGDNARQAALAETVLADAELVVFPLPVLCEFAWVLRSLYRVPQSEIAEALRRLINVENVSLNRQAVEAGLAQLDAGGDFADGVIAFEGRQFGADEFVSFDRKAVRSLEARGVSARGLK